MSSLILALITNPQRTCCSHPLLPLAFGKLLMEEGVQAAGVVGIWLMMDADPTPDPGEPLPHL